MFLRRTNLHNIRGRIDYISNPDRQEKILAYTQTFEKDDVSRLVKEASEQYNKYNRKEDTKKIEGMELIFPLRHDFLKSVTAEELADRIVKDFKNKYGVECCVAIHSASKGKNINCHLVFFDRYKLEEKEITKASRNFYYDKDWKRTNKANAVHIIKKGDVISERLFSNKDPKFYTREFLKEVKNYFAENLLFTNFDKSRHFATKHIGKHNPKKKYIEEYNNVVMDINNYFDELEKLTTPEIRNNNTPKKLFLNYLKYRNVEKLSIDELQDKFYDFQKVVEESLLETQKETSDETNEEQEEE